MLCDRARTILVFARRVKHQRRQFTYIVAAPAADRLDQDGAGIMDKRPDPQVMRECHDRAPSDAPARTLTLY